MKLTLGAENRESVMVFAVVAACLLALSTASTNPCADYETLSEPQRHLDYVATTSDQKLCDERIDEHKYYRFGAGEMHNECVKDKRCGTDKPVFLNATLPTEPWIGDREEWVCSYDRVFRDCCGTWRSKIKVRYCSGTEGADNFYVYSLRKITHNKCNMAYCASGNGTGPGQVTLEPPPIITTPVFTGPTSERATLKSGGQHYNDFYFGCQVNRPAHHVTDERERFDVLFTFDGNSSDHVPPKTTNDSNLLVKLWSKELKGNVGKRVGCKVRSHWLNSLQNSNFLTAERSYFVGIVYTKMNETDVYPLVNITEMSHPVTVHVRSTVPISCPETENHTSCEFALTFYDVRDDVGIGHCAITFKGLEQGYKQHVEQTIKARPTPGTHNRFSTIFFKKIVTGHPDFFWEGYLPPNLVVKVEDSSKMFLCQSYGVLHIRTFDARHYDYISEGDYILVKSSAPRHFEVHVRQHGNATEFNVWNCAVAVREGNNVLGIDICQYPHMTPTPIRYHVDEHVPGAVISHNGHTYIISMPSGAYVKVVVFGKMLSIGVFLNSEDHGKTTGMCGNLNGDKEDDAVPPFAHIRGHTAPETVNYRLNMSDSLINSHKYPIKCHPSSASATNICSCKSTGSVPCGAPKVISNAMTTTFETIHTKSCTGGTKPHTGHLMISEHEFPIPRDLSKDHGHPLNAHFPTKSGITETLAQSHCSSLIQHNSSAYNICKDHVSSHDEESIIKSCVIEVHIMDTADIYLQYIIDSYEELCLNEMENKVVTTSTETTTHPPTDLMKLVDTVRIHICKKHCPEAHGDCDTHGVCKCKSGYAGEYCSIVINSPPRLTSFRKGPLCDSSESDCKTISIYVDNFDVTKNLSFKVTETNKSKTFHEPAVPLSSHDISFKLPAVRNSSSSSHDANEIEFSTVYLWNIELSHDGGNHYSNAMKLTVFDSRCHTCDAHGVCHDRQHPDEFCPGSSSHVVTTGAPDTTHGLVKTTAGKGHETSVKTTARKGHETSVKTTAGKGHETSEQHHLYPTTQSESKKDCCLSSSSGSSGSSGSEGNCCRKDPLLTQDPWTYIIVTIIIIILIIIIYIFLRFRCHFYKNEPYVTRVDANKPLSE